MPLLPRSANDLPEQGAWAPYQVEGQRTAVISCPECGHQASIEAYEIGKDGKVKPGLRCNDGCGWYDTHVQLQGWQLN
jgi:hypothetical protein